MLVLSNYETNKLDHIAITLEKSIKSLVDKCEKCISYFDTDLKESYEDAEKQRLQELNSISRSIQSVTKSLKSKIDLLKNKKIGEIKDYEAFKIEMVDIQDNIMNMKRASKSELNKLKSLENDTNDELNMYYNGKVAEWSNSLNISSLEFVPPKIKNKNTGQCKEVKQFFDFVHHSGGHENGWRKEDHLLFLKFRGKYKKIDDIAFHVHEILPDISIEEIKSHEDWYTKYLTLQSNKKEAINRWKQNKDNTKHFSKRAECNENICLQNTSENNSNLREKLMQWKIEKEEKLLMEKELEKQRILDKIEKDRIRKQNQIEIKKIVNEWRESKMIFEQSQKQHQRMYQELETKRRAANANKLIKQFQSMDEIHILKMRQIKKKLTDEPMKRVKSGPPVLRDPRRLMQPTIQWTQRVRALNEPLHRPLPIFATPKLAIPEWRKSIM